MVFLGKSNKENFIPISTKDNKNITQACIAFTEHEKGPIGRVNYITFPIGLYIYMIYI